MKKLNEFIEKVGMDKVAHFFGIALVALIVSLVFTRPTQASHPPLMPPLASLAVSSWPSPRRPWISSRATSSRILACQTSQPVRQVLSWRP